AVAERFEGDGRLDGPAARKPSHRDIPHRVPVGAELTLVGALSIHARAERVDFKLKRVAPIVKRIEREADAIAHSDVIAVTPHFVGYHAVRLTFPRSYR